MPNKARDRSRVAPAVAAAVNGCCTMAQPWPLVLLGPTGVGKTCAVLLMTDRFGGIYTTLDDLTERFRQARMGTLTEDGVANCTPRKVHPVDMLWEWYLSPLVVLDELGLPRASRDHEYQVLRGCMDRREGLPAVYVSNLSLTELARVYDDRVSRRLSDGTVVEMTA